MTTTHSLPEAIERVREWARVFTITTASTERLPDEPDRIDLLAVCDAASRAEAAERERSEAQDKLGTVQYNYEQSCEALMLARTALGSHDQPFLDDAIRSVLDKLAAAERELEAVRANLYAAMKVVAHARLAWQADHPALIAFDAATSTTHTTVPGPTEAQAEYVAEIQQWQRDSYRPDRVIGEPPPQPGTKEDEREG